MNAPRLDQQTLQAIVERCSPLVVGLDETEPRVPIKVLLTEAYIVAEVVEDYLDPQTIDGKQIPGLRSLIDAGQLPADLSSQMREFSTAVAKVQSDLVTLRAQVNNSPIERGETIVRELRAALSFLLEDGSNPEGEAQLDQLRDAYDPTSSQSTLAVALEGFSNLGMQYADELRKLPSFDVTLLDEAVQVAADLRQRQADRISGDSETRQRELLSLRNRLIAGLMARMTTARRAVRFLFRDEPEIVRKVGSEYERERRQARRRNKDSEVVPTSEASADETMIPEGRVAS